MSKLRNFIEQIPLLCEAKQPEVRGLRNVLIFDYEILNKESILSRENFKEDPDSRLDVLFDFEGNENKKKYCRALLNIKMYTGYGENDKVEENIKVLSTLEPDENIDSVYNVTDASASDGSEWVWF